jgi:predicted ATP-dependent endonuclease of OLD family
VKIRSLTLQNFRCFGADAVTIDLFDSTALVGANGAGKSAALEALVRLFGPSASYRRLVRSDFHLPADQAADEVEEATLLIEARLDFPELEEEGNGDAVPECFNQMTVAGEDGALYCRVRLEATWRPTSSPEGEIDEPVYWIKTDAAHPAEGDKVAMQNFDRSRIQVIYVPAARDPVRQMRQVSGSLLYRLLRAVNWSDAVRDAVQVASEQLRTAFRGEGGVVEIEQAIASAWRALHKFRAYSEVGIQPVGGRFEDLLRKVEIAFRPGEGGVEQGIDRLSDGLKSLFYFSLVGATFDIEQAARAGGSEILADELRLPTLKVFAIEEAENHLAPHYLGRILKLLKRMGESPNAQVVLTSQSPAILGRIDPETVRHFRLDAESQTTIVRAITLPSADDAGEAYKFVKEAVRAFPELYFASLVVLGEGDSEEIVLPRVATAANLPVDTSFVSVVPLGGRHVNHFWQLLNDLSIPFVTLLDLDRERHGGGWARVKYACAELMKIGVEKNEILRLENGVLADADFAKMHTWSLNGADDAAKLDAWAEDIERFDVFFSAPLDIDFLMLIAFPDAYHKATPGLGPKIPQKGTPEYETRLNDARFATLKPKGLGGSTYSEEEKAEFIWYAYLFLGRGKPATHILGLNQLGNEELRDGTPAVLQRLIARMREKLGDEEEEG